MGHLPHSRDRRVGEQAVLDGEQARGRPGSSRRSSCRCARCGCATVLGAITSSLAISLLDQPRATSRSTSISRAVRPAGPSRRRPTRWPAANSTASTASPIEASLGDLAPQLGGRGRRRQRGAVRASLAHRLVRVGGARGCAPAGRSPRPTARPGTPSRRAARGIVRRSRRAAPVRTTAGAFAASGRGACGRAPTRRRPTVPACPRWRWRRRGVRGRGRARRAEGSRRRRPPSRGARRRRPRGRRRREHGPACRATSGRRSRPPPAAPGRTALAVRYTPSAGSAAMTASHDSAASTRPKMARRIGAQQRRELGIELRTGALVGQHGAQLPHRRSGARPR